MSFSQDLIEEVLLRVPADELLNLKRVSKTWKATIESQRFIKRHMMKMRSSSPRLLVFESYKKNEPPQNIYAARGFLESPAATAAKLDWHYYGSKKKKKNMRSVEVSFCGSCHGLVCLVLTDTRRRASKMPKIVLWNPSTNQHFELPFSPIKKVDQFGYGFGYDEAHDEYKVVSLAQFYYPYRLEVEVYSLKTNSFRSLPEFPYVLSHRVTKATVFARGSIHWCTDAAAAAGSGETVNPNFIVALNLASEKYHLLSLPEGIGSMEIEQIEVLDDSLCLTVYHYNNYRHTDKVVRGYRSYWKADVWVMKEYGVRESWTKLCVLPLDYYKGLRTMPYSEGKKQEFIMFQIGNYLRRFDTEAKGFDSKITLVDDSTAKLRWWMSSISIEAYLYVPSLVRLPTQTKTKTSALARVKHRIHSSFAK